MSGRDWSTMRRVDFDPSAPLALVDEDDVARPVLAVPDAFGTEALFGDEPRPMRNGRRRTPAVPAPPEVDALF
ncbi:hypothetical protein ACIBAC_00670 [Streptomyces sp. NPDC051362]|uniref:hypothetical protein n=1 Tax=Streptomyces sp. NPDC051362 TaxID=3365651 RepID=UPI0037A92CA5